MDFSPPGSSVDGILQARILEWVAFSFSRGSSRPRDRTWASCVGRWILYCLGHQGSRDYLIFKDIVRWKDTGVGSHFFLRRIFLTQIWNPGLLHCRQILYCLSHWWGPAVRGLRSHILHLSLCAATTDACMSQCRPSTTTHTHTHTGTQRISLAFVGFGVDNICAAYSEPVLVLPRGRRWGRCFCMVNAKPW